MPLTIGGIRIGLVHWLHVAADSKTVTALGLAMGAAGTTIAALALDEYMRTRFPWLPAAGIGLTTVGGLLATYGRGLADRHPTMRQMSADADAVENKTGERPAIPTVPPA